MHCFNEHFVQSCWRFYWIPSVLRILKCRLWTVLVPYTAGVMTFSREYLVFAWKDYINQFHWTKISGKKLRSFWFAKQNTTIWRVLMMCVVITIPLTYAYILFGTMFSTTFWVFLVSTCKCIGLWIK